MENKSSNPAIKRDCTKASNPLRKTAPADYVKRWVSMSRLSSLAILVTCFFTPAHAGPDQSVDEWYNPPQVASWRVASHPISEDLFFELPISKAFSAVTGELKRKVAAHIDADSLRFYVSGHFRCPSDRSPYLVRALFGHGGTGRYHVLLLDGNLIIDHESIGRINVMNRSALIICLFAEPAKVFTVVGIDQ